MFSSIRDGSVRGRRVRRRRMVLVDIENVACGAIIDVTTARQAKRQITQNWDPRPDDHTVIGVSHIGLLPTGCSWPGVRYVVESGPDGADHALLEVFGEDIAARFDEVVLVSGDGIFTDAIVALAAAGVHVTVIAHRGGLAKRLRMAAHAICYLPDHDTREIVAGAA